MNTALPPNADVRRNVRELLLSSPAYTKLPAATQQQIAHDMTQVADYIAAPEGIPANRLPNAPAIARAQADTPQADPRLAASTYQRDVAQVNRVSEFKAAGAREGVEVAGALMRAVNFPDFVASLIQGVFHAIVTASIEQMEAYGKLVADVAKSLNSFRDENVSPNQGRDHLVEQFPDVFEIGTGGEDFFGGGGGGPRVKLREGVDESRALERVNSSLPMEGGPLQSLDLEEQKNEDKLVQAARTQLATSRQQLLATMVLMGINRIVVTDGKIQAKILYDFQARDSRKLQRSAAAFDYARDQYGNLQRTATFEGEREEKTEGGATTRSADGAEERRDANYYSKGTYRYAEKPVMTAMSTAQETSDAALQTKASLAGLVDVNFKSDYFPLEKMADSFQIAQIQNASKPGKGAAPAAAAAPAATPPPATPAPAPAAAPVK
jgi:hypothetical protein